MSARDATEKTGRRALPIILIVLATIVGVTSVFGLWASASCSKPRLGARPARS